MIKVSGCRVLVKPYNLQQQDKVFASAKAAGIVLQEFSERKEQANVDKGVVIQIGAKCHEDYIGDVVAGDTIGFAKFGGKFVTDTDDTLYLIINDEDVLYKEIAHE